MRNHPPIDDDEHPGYCYCGKHVAADIHLIEDDPELVHELEDATEDNENEDGM